MKMTLPRKSLKIAVVQNNAGSDVGKNLRRIEQLLSRSPACDLIALPEVFYIRGADRDYRANAQSPEGVVMRWLERIAASRRSWILAGSIIEKEDTKDTAGPAVVAPERRYAEPRRRKALPGFAKGCAEASALPRAKCIIGRAAASTPRRPKFFNTCFLLDRCGRIAAKYRKIHLFEAHLDNGKCVRESDIYSAGHRPMIVNIEGWICGLSICYDLRFPELYRHYSSRGAHLFFVPANFTQATGKDHWETLLRARAIENQAFVVAPDQCGANPRTGIASYGNSMVIGPWGEIICRAGERECGLTATLDPAELRRTRARIPALQHRRL